MKISICRAAIMALVLLLSLFRTDHATAEAQYVNAQDFVSPGSDLTYFDLALQFAPGLAKTPADGTEISKLRHIAGDQETIAVPSLGGVKRLDVAFDGKPALLLMFDLGQADESVASVNVLALYDMSAKPQLLDAMDVGLDRETGFLEESYLQLSPKFGMAFVRNSHHNAGEEYLQTSLVGIWGNKLHDVDTVMSMSWMTGQQELRVTPSFASVTNAVALDAIFAVKTTKCGGDCEPDVDYPSTTERVTARYSWDAAAGKFVRPERAYDRIPLPYMEE